MSAHILLVDENQDLLEVLRDGFTLPGHTVVTATNGFAALSIMVQDDCPDAVVVGDLDPRDPTPSLELVSDLRVGFTGLRTPIVMLSTHTDDNVKSQALASGADRYLVKPSSISTIVNTVLELFDRAA